MTPKYWETVVIGWRILWQGIGGFLLALFLLNLIILGLQPELTRTDPSFWVLAFPLILASILSLFIVLPLVVRGLLKRSFGTFRLVVKRVEPMNS
jgi:hypothetical protein